MFRIGKQRKVEIAATVCGQLSGKLFTDFGRVNTDGIQSYVFIFLQQRAESGQLPGAIWSPVAAIEDEHNGALAPRLRERCLVPTMVLKREIRRRLADPDRRGAWCLSLRASRHYQA